MTTKIAPAADLNDIDLAAARLHRLVDVMAETWMRAADIDFTSKEAQNLDALLFAVRDKAAELSAMISGNFVSLSGGAESVNAA